MRAEYTDRISLAKSNLSYFRPLLSSAVTVRQIRGGTSVGKAPGMVNNELMIRIREIMDPELRERIIGALAERRGVSAAAIPDWFELDDLDYVDLLNDLKEQEYDGGAEADWRM